MFDTMPSHTVRDEKNTKNVSVTAKCLAIVLSESETRDSCADNDLRSRPPLNGKQLLDDFQMRNKTCYWNPTLVESIKRLCYKGFLEPSTILVVGNEIHLENLRTAWGRRVLKAPFGFNIQRIGDVSGIEMQVIPQTQFIPLPDALCLIIMELNNRCIMATLDTIKEQLLDCYKEMTMPNEQLIFDTLGTLIHQRKIFHSGNGYFVVTPETYRHPTDDRKLSFNTSWLPYHPLYIPVFPQIQEMPPPLQHLHQHCHPATAVTRSISCQVGVSEQLQPFQDLCKTDNKEEIKARPRSLSFRESRHPKGSKEQERITRDRESTLKHSTSLKYKNKSNDIKDINLKNSNINKEIVKGDKEKVSFFAKIFSRSKKKKNCNGDGQTLVSDLQQTEYASFCAQFPPPEWQWYKQQMEKQRRTEEWVCNQVEKSITPQCFHESVPSTENGIANKHASCEVDREGHTCKKDAMKNDHSNRPRKRQERRKGKLKSDDYSVPVICQDFQDVPSPVLPAAENVYQLVVEHKGSGPSHSTPRLYESISTLRDRNLIGFQKSLKSISVKQSHTQRRRSHRSSGCFNQNDINFEYVGILPNKNSQNLKSRDSGVNCVGLPMTVPNNKPNDIKCIKHHPSPVIVRNKFDTCKDECLISDALQCEISKISEDHIGDLALAHSTKCNSADHGFPERMQAKFNPTYTTTTNSNSQHESRKEDISNYTCNAHLLNSEKTMSAAHKKRDSDNFTDKTSSGFCKDSNIKFVDSGFSSPRYGEVKSIVSSKLNSQRNGNCDADHRNERHWENNKEVKPGFGQQISENSLKSAAHRPDVFHQKTLCGKRFGGSTDYEIVGVL